MTSSVRHVHPEDWQRLRAVRLEALAESPESFGSDLAREQAFDEDEWRTRAARPATFVASHAGTDVGLAGVYELDDGWCVMGMWVAPRARGTGVVDVLVGACETIVVEAGAPRMALWVMEENARGIRAYSRLGFTPDGTIQLAPDGRRELLMVKTYDGPARG